MIRDEKLYISPEADIYVFTSWTIIKLIKAVIGILVTSENLIILINESRSRAD